MESNFYLQFENSKIKRAVLLEESIFFRFRKLEKKIFALLALLTLILYFFNKSYFGLFLIFLSLTGLSFLKDLFFENYLKEPRERKKLVDYLSLEVARAIVFGQWLVRKTVINSSVLLFSILNLKDWKTNFIFSRLLVDKNELKEWIKSDLKGKDNLPEILEKALEIAKEKNKNKIEVTDVIPVLFQENELLKKFLIEKELKWEDIKDVAEWADYLEKEFLDRKKFWEWENLLKKGTLGRDLAAGYTITLDRFSFDITRSMQLQGFRKIFAHQKEVEKIERILASPQKNDVLIVGEEGSGRRSMLELLAVKCATGKSFPEINFYKVVLLDLQKLIAATETTEETEALLDRIFSEVVKAGNVILAIDNIHNYIGVETQRKAGSVDISPILSSYLPSSHFKLIGITTPQGLHQNIEKVPAILDYFEKIDIEPVTFKETFWILADRALRLERKYKIFTPFISLKRIISLCDQYLPNIPFPEKAMTVLDEALSLAYQKKEKIILPSHVEIVISRKSKIPVGKLEETEKQKLLSLEDLLHQRVIDQEEAIIEVSNALRRARAQLKIRKGPIGCFLFLGPTGVGKTETARALADIYFGSEERMIRLDMSEFQKVEDIDRLLGQPGQEGLLTTPVRENPFSLLLLDEFEKAHPNILNLFLQVFDEGHLTDGVGRRVDFKNTIIIATSNAGYQLIFEATKSGKDLATIKEELINFLIQNDIFRPELLNRFDAVVVFKPLTQKDLLQIAELILKKIQKNLKEQDIDFVITQALKEKIVQISYKPEFGAREMQRVIQEKVVNALAKAILAGKVKRGAKVEIDPETFEVITY